LLSYCHGPLHLKLNKYPDQSANTSIGPHFSEENNFHFGNIFGAALGFAALQFA
jgi:hypothetical protein